MKKCGFCFETAKMSGEHVFSDWMNKLFPGEWTRRFNLADGTGFTEQSPKLNWKAKVVCEKCNNTWMSSIEELHARPLLTPLIVGKINVPIGPSEAESIAIFAFKTAAVVDLIPKRPKQKEPFFSPRLRAAFKRNQTVPPLVWMWMCPYIPGTYRADVFVACNEGKMSLVGPIQLYVCTYAIGHFAFQVVSIKAIGKVSLRPDPAFDRLAVGFWPKIEPQFVWPRRIALRSLEELEKFHRRWENTYTTVH
jgi:hypothetical protein